MVHPPTIRERQTQVLRLAALAQDDRIFCERTLEADIVLALPLLARAMEVFDAVIVEGPEERDDFIDEVVGY